MVFGVDLDRSSLSALAFVGGLIAWIWISEVIKKRTYDNATPSAPVTSFNQISLIIAPIFICFIIFSMGYGLGTAATDAVSDYQTHQKLEKVWAEIGTPTIPEASASCIAGNWGGGSYAYNIWEDGALDCHSRAGKLSGQWVSTGEHQYEFTYQGSDLIEYVTMDSGCGRFTMSNNRGEQGWLRRT